MFMRRTLVLSLLFLTLAAYGAGALARGMTVAERREIRLQRATRPVLPASSAGSSASRSAVRPIVRTGPVSIPVLVYHHIRPTMGYAKSTWSWKMSVSPAVFGKHMQWLSDHDYTTVTMDTLTDILDGTCTGPVKPVVITFDDNNRTQYEVAFPILKKHWFKGVFYFVANRVESPTYITRAEIKEMADAGMDVQSHTVTHAWMTTRTPTQLDHEILESKRILEEITGKVVSHLAYPSVMHNETVRKRVKELGYKTATIMDPRNATDKDDRFRLPRIMMTDDTNLAKVLP